MTDVGFVLDAGAFIAVERGDDRMRSLTMDFRRRGTLLTTSAGVVAQVWRGGVHKQVEVAFLLRRTEIIDLTASEARIVGTLLGATRTSDPVDAHVVLLARRRGWPVLSSDRDDLRAIDPKLDVYPI